MGHSSVRSRLIALRLCGERVEGCLKVRGFKRAHGTKGDALQWTQGPQSSRSELPAAPRVCQVVFARICVLHYLGAMSRVFHVCLSAGGVFGSICARVACGGCT